MPQESETIQQDLGLDSPAFTISPSEGMEPADALVDSVQAQEEAWRLFCSISSIALAIEQDASATVKKQG